MFRTLFSTHSPQEGDTVAFFDIGSANIGASIVRYSKDKKPEFLYTTREPIRSLTKTTRVDIKKATLSALLLVSSRLQEEGVSAEHIPQISEAVVVLGAPHYRAKVSRTKREMQRPQRITHGLIEEMVNEEHKTICGVWGEETKETQHIIESAVTQTTLNEYVVKDPLGKSARKIDLSLYTGAIEKTLFDEIERVIGSVFSLEHIHMHTYPYAAYSSLSSIYPNTPSYLFLDISGEATDYVLVECGGVCQVEKAEVGKYALLRGVHELCGESIADTTSRVKAYIANSLSEKEKKKLDPIFLKARKEWLLEVEKLISLSEEIHTIPPKLFLTADSDVLPWYTEALKQKNSRITEYTTQILPLREKELSRYVTTSSDISIDPFLVILAMFWYNHSNTL